MTGNIIQREQTQIAGAASPEVCASSGHTASGEDLSGYSTPGPAPDTAAAELIAFVDRTDAACPGCGYRLAGLRDAVCPECGEALEVRVNIVEPRFGAYLAMMAGYFGVVGACGSLVVGVIGVWAFMSLWRGGGGTPPAAVWLIPLLVLMVYLPATIHFASPRGRRWFRGLALPPRWAMVASGWALGFLAMVLYVIVLALQ